MTSKRVDELSPAAQRRMLNAALLRAAACAALLVVVYYLAPLDRALDAGTWIEFVLGLVVFAVIVGYETRAIIASDVPRLRLIHAVATGLPTLLLLFAATYVLIARDDPDSFSEMLSRTGSLYFTLTVFATVGFGDIAPRSDVARILTMIQMIVDLVAVGLIAKILLGAVDIAKQRRKNEAAENDDRSEGGE
jgi:voltage-gated potassium channel